MLQHNEFLGKESSSGQLVHLVQITDVHKYLWAKKKNLDSLFAT